MKEDITPLIDAWQTQGLPWKAKVKATARKHQLQEKTLGPIRCPSAGRGHFPTWSLSGWGVWLFFLLRYSLCHTTRPASSPTKKTPDIFCWTAVSARSGLFALWSVLLDYSTLAAAFGIYSQTTGILVQSVFPCSFYARQVDYYHAEKMPKIVVGLARREFLQTYGPQGGQTTALHMQRQNWQHELDDCYQQLEITAQSEHVMGKGGPDRWCTH